MPLALLLLLAGGGALGLYLYGKHQGQRFDFENCLYEKKRQGYTDDKAIEICKTEAKLYQQSQSTSSVQLLLEFGVPAIVLGGLGYYLYKMEKKKGVVSELRPIAPEQIARNLEKAQEKQQEVKKSLEEIKTTLEGVDGNCFPHPCR